MRKIIGIIGVSMALALSFVYAAETSAPNIARASSLDLIGYTPVLQLQLEEAGTTSFVRFSNASSQIKRFEARIVGGESGTDYLGGQTYEISVPPKASPQRSFQEIRAAVRNSSGVDITPRNGDSFVTLYVRSSETSPDLSVQHITYNGQTGFLENVGVCTFDPVGDYSTLGRRLINVHTSRIGGYSSRILINNPDSMARMVRGRVYDAVTGTAIGAFTINPVANSTVALEFAAIEQQLGFTPSAAQLHVNIEFESADAFKFTAVVGHKVRQLTSGAVFNLTQTCPLTPIVSACSATSSNPSGGSSGGATNPSGSVGSGSDSGGGSCAPVAVADTLTQTFTVGQRSTILLETLTRNDTNATGAVLEGSTEFVDAGTSTANGTSSYTAFNDITPASFTYTPARAGTVTFTYRIRTNGGISGFAQVTLRVTAPPIAVNDTLTQTFTVGKASTIDLSTLTANDTDAAGATLESVSSFVQSGSSTANGTYTATASSITYTPARAGTVTFSYQIRNQGQVSNAATVTLTVNGDSSPPRAVEDVLTQTFIVGQPATIALFTLTANDAYAEGATLLSITPFVDDNGTANGTSSFTASSISYTPARAGTVRFEYMIVTGAGSSLTRVTLTVSGPPVAVNDTLTQSFTPGTGVVIPLSTLTANDSNASGATLETGIVTVVDAGTTTSNGIAQVSPSQISWTPDHVGTVTLTYRIRNSIGFSNTATITATVSAASLWSGSTATLNFDSVSGTSAIPGAVCYDLTSYLAGYGITLTGASAGTVVTAGAANACFHSDVVVSSLPNALYVPNNQPVSFVMNFDRPLNSVGFTRARLNAGPSGVNTVGWTATGFSAVNAGGTQLGQIGENAQSAFGSNFIAARFFTLSGAGIRSVRFERTNPSGQNTSFGVSFPVIDDLVLTPQ